MQKCPRCNLIHIGSLVGVPGLMVLFLSDWEATCEECDLDFQLWNQIPLFKSPVPSNLVRFEGMPANI
jgi:hypothetical protein